MSLKEFSHKYSLLFFWATVVLFIIVVAMSVGRAHRGMMMRNGFRNMDNNGGYGRMMNRPGSQPQDGQQQGLMRRMRTDDNGEPVQGQGTMTAPEGVMAQ